MYKHTQGKKNAALWQILMNTERERERDRDRERAIFEDSITLKIHFTKKILTSFMAYGT